METLIVSVLIIIALLVGGGIIYAVFTKTPVQKMSNGDFWQELAAKLKQKKIAVMVQEKRKAPVWQATAKIVDGVVVLAFIEAVKARAIQGVSRLSAAELNIIHAAVNDTDGKLPATLDVLAVIIANTNEKMPDKAVLTFRYYKRTAGKTQEISHADPTEVHTEGLSRDVLQKIDFSSKLVESFAGFKDAVMGKRVKVNRR